MKKYFSFVKEILLTLLFDFNRIWSLALFKYKVTYRGMFLNSFWRIASPFIQIGVYWLVFGIGIRNGNPVNGVPYLSWLTCGITPWLILNSGILKSSDAIYSRIQVLVKSKVPAYIMPISQVFAVILENIWTVALLFVIVLANGCKMQIQTISILYYMFCTVCFLSSISLITSALVVMARDFQMVIQMCLRLLFFVTPVFWDPNESSMPRLLTIVFKFNPFAYIISGFRESILFGKWFFDSIEEITIFWIVVIALFFIGALLQKKISKNLLDFL